MKNFEKLLLINSPSYSESEYIDVLRKNIKADFVKNSKNKYFNKKELEKIIESASEKNIYYTFNSIVNFLNSIGNKTIDKDNIILDREKLKVKENQIFLSHAYTDKLYTFILFLYMQENDVFLYVDWIFNDKIDDGKILKEYLTRELKKSKQLLFLRTVNSELQIRGSGVIRPWCTWELGNYYSIYSKDIENKFYIELYEKSNETKANNIQLDGISPLTDIVKGTLV